MTNTAHEGDAVVYVAHVPLTPRLFGLLLAEINTSRRSVRARVPTLRQLIARDTPARERYTRELATNVDRLNRLNELHGALGGSS